LTGDDGQLDPPALHIKHGVSRIALGEDHLAGGITGGSSTLAGLSEKTSRIEFQTWVWFHTDCLLDRRQSDQVNEEQFSAAP